MKALLYLICICCLTVPAWAHLDGHDNIDATTGFYHIVFDNSAGTEWATGASVGDPGWWLQSYDNILTIDVDGVHWVGDMYVPRYYGNLLEENPAYDPNNPDANYLVGADGAIPPGAIWDETFYMTPALPRDSIHVSGPAGYYEIIDPAGSIRVDIPEPASVGLLATGAVTLLVNRRRKR